MSAYPLRSRSNKTLVSSAKKKTVKSPFRVRSASPAQASMHMSQASMHMSPASMHMSPASMHMSPASMGPATRAKTKASTAIVAPVSPPKKVRITVRRLKKSVSPQKSAATKIINFMRKTKHTRKSHYLLTKCPNPSVCLALDTYATDIKNHFKGFTAFDYATDIQQIGRQSNNGFIKKITYQHRDYSAYAILKSSQTPDADNLMYEYIVGQYINKLNKQFSCFVETYGYYIYEDEVDWREMKEYDNINVLKNNLIHQDNTNFEEACLKSKYLAILIQYLSGVQSMYDMIRNREFLANDLLGCLFQMYMPLATVKDTFTHYDLHLDNIQLYQPKKGYYIHYHYELPMGVVLSFKSSYMTKIIDYGRCYFNDIESGMNSKDIFDEVCDAYNCQLNKKGKVDEEECGRRKGFTWLADDEDPKSVHYIIAQKPNISHDLLPLARLKDKVYNKYPPPPGSIKKIHDSIFNAVNYAAIPPASALEMRSFYFGTPEILKSGFPGKINNVQDAFEQLYAALSSTLLMEKNERDYADDKVKKMGDLTIYSDGRPMSYVPMPI